MLAWLATLVFVVFFLRWNAIHCSHRRVWFSRAPTTRAIIIIYCWLTNSVSVVDVTVGHCYHLQNHPWWNLRLSRFAFVFFCTFSQMELILLLLFLLFFSSSTELKFRSENSVLVRKEEATVCCCCMQIKGRPSLDLKWILQPKAGLPDQVSFFWHMNFQF